MKTVSGSAHPRPTTNESHVRGTLTLACCWCFPRSAAKTPANLRPPQRSEPAARPSSAEPRPQETSSNTGDDAEHGQAPSAPRAARRNRQPPGQFDFYLLNLSWSPEFCATHSDSPECGRNLGFVVHGLWPQDANGDYPEHCSNAPGPANPQADTDIIPTVSLVEHEWQTHGTCSGLGVDDYFAAIHKAFAEVKAPSNIGQGSDADGLTPDVLLGQICGSKSRLPARELRAELRYNRLDRSGNLPEQRPAARNLPGCPVLPGQRSQGDAAVEGTLKGVILNGNRGSLHSR